MIFCLCLTSEFRNGFESPRFQQRIKDITDLLTALDRPALLRWCVSVRVPRGVNIEHRWFVDDGGYMMRILFEGAVAQQTNNPCESAFNWFKNHKLLDKKQLSIAVQQTIVSVIALARVVTEEYHSIAEDFDGAAREVGASGQRCAEPVCTTWRDPCWRCR